MKVNLADFSGINRGCRWSRKDTIEPFAILLLGGWQNLVYVFFIQTKAESGYRTICGTLFDPSRNVKNAIVTRTLKDLFFRNPVVLAA